MTHEELELKSLFQAQRAVDAASAPRFARTLTRPHVATAGWMRPALAAMSALVIAVGIALLPRPGESPAPTRGKVATVAGESPASTSASAVPATSPTLTKQVVLAKSKPVTLSQWKSPTAALLDTPGDALWTTVPRIGTQSTSAHESKSLRE